METIVERRLEDGERLLKAFSSAGGLKFQANQALLSTPNLLKQQNRQEAGLYAARVGVRAATLPIQSIVQAGAAKSGLRLIQGTVPLSGFYLDPQARSIPSYSGASSRAGRIIVDTTVNSIHDSKALVREVDRIKPDVNISKYLSTEDNLVSDSSRPGRYRSNSYIVDTDVKSQFIEREQGNRVSRSFSKPEQSFVKYTERQDILDSSLDVKMFTLEGSNNGTRRKIDLVNTFNITSVETEALENIQRDIIPFQIVNYPTGSPPEYLNFRAYLESLTDNYTPQINETSYIGRAETLKNYTGFNRAINFGFKIAAHSKEDLKPLYNKLNRLVGSTSPTYSEDFFMQGVISEVTIGDYITRLPAFLQVSLTWDVSYPWEIEDHKVPHILDVQVGMNIIHKFTPRYRQTFIGNF